MNSNPYVEARRDWDERYADLVLGKRNWQITAGGLLLLSLILAAGVVWQGTRSRFMCRAARQSAQLLRRAEVLSPMPTGLRRNSYKRLKYDCDPQKISLPDPSPSKCLAIMERRAKLEAFVVRNPYIVVLKPQPS